MDDFTLYLLWALGNAPLHFTPISCLSPIFHSKENFIFYRQLQYGNIYLLCRWLHGKFDFQLLVAPVR